jgi:SAM-dependent methyltransferase
MDIGFYEQFSNIQDKHWWFSSKRRIVSDLLSIKGFRNQEILDVGCGAGLMLQELVKFGHVRGMDGSEEAIRFSSKVFQGEIKLGSLPDLIPFPSEQFTLVTALDVIEHVDDDVAALIAIKNVMKKDGSLLITVPAYQFLWSKHDDLNEHKRRYTKNELEQKLKLAGFNLEKISYYNTLLFPLIASIRMINKFLRLNEGSDVEMPGKFINFVLKNIFLLEKYWLRHFVFPFGVSLIAIAKK